MHKKSDPKCCFIYLGGGRRDTISHKTTINGCWKPKRTQVVHQV